MYSWTNGVQIWTGVADLRKGSASPEQAGSEFAREAAMIS
jgi:hypothetical protein